MSLIALFHDFETTGVKPGECGVVSACHIVAEIHDNGSYNIRSTTCYLTNPGMPIPAEASAVHGIYDEDVADAPHWESTLRYAFERLDGTVQAIGGYNTLRYDNIIGARCGMPAGLKQLDLYVATNRMKSAGLLEKANLGAAYSALTGMSADNAHNAEADVRYTLELIKPCMDFAEVSTIHEFIEWLERPFASPNMKVPFGKHKGQSVRTLPASYLQWMKDNCNLQPDLEASVSFALRKGLHK